MGKKLGQLLTAVLFLLILPMLPLLAEYFRTHDIKEDSITLCIAFYAFCLSVSTKSPFIFALCLIMGIIESFRYDGKSQVSGLPVLNTLEFYIFLAVFLAHLVERIRRHCYNSEMFFNFT
jgi:hypothetical protein